MHLPVEIAQPTHVDRGFQFDDGKRVRKKLRAAVVSDTGGARWASGKRRANLFGGGVVSYSGSVWADVEFDGDGGRKEALARYNKGSEASA